MSRTGRFAVSRLGAFVVILSLVFGAGLVRGWDPATTVLASQSEGKKPMLAHMVYFSLKDRSEPAKTKLVGACHKYLKEHPGVVFFAAGVVAADLDREVNVRDFDVALHVVFKTREDHDRYQVAPKHQQFIKENSENWEKVRVFDSYVN